MTLAETIKGWRLPFAGDPLNHGAQRSLNGTKVLVLVVSYKANTSDSRAVRPATAAVASARLAPRTVESYRRYLAPLSAYPPDERTHEMATGVRVAITLACTECKRRNYQTQKSKRNSPDRVEFKKYCRWCGRHTAHRETR